MDTRTAVDSIASIQAHHRESDLLRQYEGGTVPLPRKAIDSFRGNPPSVDAASGFIGLQTHTGQVSFANVRIKTL
jgi:hypothetical protein